MQYNQVASKWAEKKASEQAIEESLSQEQQAARERKYLGQVAAAKERMAKSKTTKSNKAAQTKLASLEKAGTFESEEDKVAATQLKWLQSGKPVSQHDYDTSLAANMAIRSYRHTMSTISIPSAS